MIHPMSPVGFAPILAALTCMRGRTTPLITRDSPVTFTLTTSPKSLKVSASARSAFSRGLLSALVWGLAFLPGIVPAHHGVASLGAIGLEGPGAPLETTVSTNLPQGSWLLYQKFDYANFKTYTHELDDEKDYNLFSITGLGYGLTPWFTAYAFLPYTVKAAEDDDYSQSGLGDISLTGTLGFKYDDGFKLTPKSESLDDWYDWHFSFFFGLTLPTGNPNLRGGPAGEIDPGMSLGFGQPSYMLGLGATRLITDRDTLNLDVSWIGFQENEYDDGHRFRFGDEWRVNLAWVRKLTTDIERKTRWDAALEANFLHLDRDRIFGQGEWATGGDILYLLPGVRYYVDNLSFALGVKVPVWTQLNEEDEQQGAEGKENYRLIFTLSALF